MSHILYSFRRCPYAMRARLAIQLWLPASYLELREVVLKNKPQSMLEISPKGTVPVLQLSDGAIIEESLDIMHWALKLDESNIANFYSDAKKPEIDELISENDGDFKWALDRYKYSDRFEESESYYREKADVFLAKLEARLNKNVYLTGDEISFADLAIFPFVRQFAHVNKKWFEQQEKYSKLNNWLQYFLKSDTFSAIMKKYPAWTEGDDKQLFPSA